MGQLTDIFGKNDVSSTTKAGFKRSGLDAQGGYGETPAIPPPPPPPLREQASQVGSIQVDNTKKLEEMLMKNGLTKEQAQEKIKAQGKATGVTYK